MERGNEQQRITCSKLHSFCNVKHFLMGQPWPLFAYFPSIQTNNTIFTTNHYENISCPYSIRCQDSNPRRETFYIHYVYANLNQAFLPPAKVIHSSSDCRRSKIVRSIDTKFGELKENFVYQVLLNLNQYFIVATKRKVWANSNKRKSKT